jgi:hypothetical protein
MAAFTITLPPSTQTEIDGLCADLRAAVQKYSVLADKLDAALDAIKATADAGTQAIPQIQSDVKQATVAVAAFHFKGPLGVSGGTS